MESGNLKGDEGDGYERWVRSKYVGIERERW